MSQINLNDRQKEAVDYNDGHLLIIAGAGTGKTAVITQRIINIINKELAKPSEILALTFMEKAATEMSQRIDIEMPLGYEEPWISTIHSFCDRILRTEGYNIGLDTAYSLMTDAQSYIFFKKNLFKLSLKKFLPNGNPSQFINDILKHFSRLQDEDVSTQDYLDYANNLPEDTDEEKEVKDDTKELADCYKAYTELKIKESKVDFGDLVFLTIRLFREKPNVLKKYREKFKYILVDEFQDTNYTQNVLINILVKGNDENNGPKLTVVGDDDQAIYKFRGAAISNILQFKEEYPNAKEVVLVDNYRSNQEILDSAYRLIKNNNPNRLEVTENIDKRLIARSEIKENSKEAVQFVAAQREDVEAKWIAEEISRLVGLTKKESDEEKVQVFDELGQSTFVSEDQKGDFKYSDIAILVRAHSYAETVIQELRFQGIPYKVGGAKGLYNMNEVKFLIAFLRLLTDLKDENAMYKVLVNDMWGVSPREFVEVNNIARQKNSSVLEELESMWGVKIGEEGSNDFQTDSNLIKNIFKESSIVGVTNLLMMIDSCLKMVKEEKSITEILYNFVTNSGYIEKFAKEDSGENIFRLNNISKFFEGIKEYEKSNPDSNINEYVEFLKYSVEIGDSPRVDQMDMTDFDAVNILTVHGSKGLEFPVVFVVNLVSDRFPSRNRKDKIPIPDALVKEKLSDISENEEHIQEERRLFYVAATRAKEKLYLTVSQFYGNTKTKKKPSVFLKETLNKDVNQIFDNPSIKIEEDISMIVNVKEDSDNFELVDTGIEKLSYSKVNTYEMCPKKYYYSYVMKIPSKPNASLSFGSTIHNALRDMYILLKGTKEGLGIVEGPDLEFLLESYRKHWSSFGFLSKEHEMKMKNNGEKVLTRYFEEMYDENTIPFKIEEGFSIKLEDTLFVGKIDRMDYLGKNEQTGKPIVSIIDYKTGKVKDKTDIKNDLQLPLYAKFAQERMGVEVQSAKYIFVEHLEEVEVDISEMRMVKAVKEVEDMIKRLKEKDFTPNASQFICTHCDFKDICEDAFL